VVKALPDQNGFAKSCHQDNQLTVATEDEPSMLVEVELDQPWMLLREGVAEHETDTLPKPHFVSSASSPIATASVEQRSPLPCLRSTNCHERAFSGVVGLSFWHYV
jgi:hypothetical protein